jgi:hypothetical protein
MLTALGLAGVGAYRRRAPVRHDGLVDFGGYRRQVAARRRHFDLCPATTSGETVSTVRCGKPTIWIRGESTQEPAHNQSTWAFWLSRCDVSHQTKSPSWLLHRTVRHRPPSACVQGAQKKLQATNRALCVWCSSTQSLSTPFSLQTPSLYYFHVTTLTPSMGNT